MLASRFITIVQKQSKACRREDFEHNYAALDNTYSGNGVTCSARCPIPFRVVHRELPYLN